MRNKAGDDLARNIRAELARNGLSQSAAAAHMGVSTSYLSRRLTGETSFTVDDLRALSKLVEVSISRLLGEAAA